MTVDRTNYTWDMATEDLARGSHLTYEETIEIIYVLKGLKYLHPYDTVAPLAKMISFLRAPLSRQGAAVFVEGLERLLGMVDVREL